MKLKEQIAKLNPEELVYIGSRSAFFFIGTPKEFMLECDKLSNMWLKSFNTTLSRSKTAIANFEKSVPDASAIVKKKMTDTQLHRTIEVEVSYAERLKYWADKLITLRENMAHVQEIVDTFTPFTERDVKEIYKNIDRDASIIIVDGYETARFWFKHEYDEFKQRSKKSVSYADLIEEEEEESDV